MSSKLTRLTIPLPAIPVASAHAQEATIIGSDATATEEVVFKDIWRC